MSMNPKELVFEHILYEFEMYFGTASLFRRNIKCSDVDPVLLHNMMLESHQLHLRNLIEFFCNDNNSIKMSDILTVDFRLDRKPLEHAYSTVCQAVDHLSPTRATKDLSSACSKAIIESFPIIVAKINEFLDVISDPNNVQPKHHAELSTEYIIRRIDKLKAITKGLLLVGDENA